MKRSDKELLGDKDRRRFFRHACDASVTGAFEYDREDRWNSGHRSGYLRTDAIAQGKLRVLNISEVGVAIVSKFPAIKGSRVNLKVSSAFTGSIRSDTKVRWSRKLKSSSEAYAIGLEFLEMPRGSMKNLKALLKILEDSAPGEGYPPSDQS